eukprot:TRINITY_DN35864_c0_g1_i1.p1 TRINITY_DN35864_c0_g1~~TRINITY_DN35864_c0_g1_i1.p1  ORF type:complete len:306 (+),score=24.52 TRINITY_DN35864_c0_g1_i1:161-1078(+)
MYSTSARSNRMPSGEANSRCLQMVGGVSTTPRGVTDAELRRNSKGRSPPAGAAAPGNVSDSLQSLLLTGPKKEDLASRNGRISGAIRAAADRQRQSQPEGYSSSHRAAGLQGNANRNLDFDEEARKLWARLNLDPSQVSSGPFNALDPIWRHPKTGATIYIGNQMAASSLELLQKHQVTHVVNCTDSMPLYHEASGRIRYFRFDITSHYRRVRTDEEAVAFVQPVLDWISKALASGHNVMAHCLAGAHRAGTTGVLCLMYFAGLSARDAVPTAKRCRPIIDPIGQFPDLIAKVERGWKTHRQQPS